MSGNSKSERHAQSRTDATIGAGMRVEGNIAFVGVLHIQGEVLGDICCGADPKGTLVVDKSGNVTGKIDAPHIVVSGRISGPLHSSESIEIQHGAHVSGDATYKAIDIHAGGVIEGSLIPGIATDRDSTETEPRPVAEYESPAAASVSGGPGSRRLIGGAVVVLLAVAAVALLKREPAPLAPPDAGIALKAESAFQGVAAVHPLPATSVASPEIPKAVAEESAPAVPGAKADSRPVAQASAVETPEANPANVVLVQGVNPAKPAGVILLISREPAVLFKKKRQDSGDGSRIETSQGATESIAIARNEILRVASGQDLQIFYQGRKVAPRIIASGVWMSFVPQSSGVASESK